ncbi:MAG: hypothetical protein ABL964_08570 [Steroidobacteraceae bacterium]
MRTSRLLALAGIFLSGSVLSPVTHAAGPHEFTAQVDVRLIAANTPLRSFMHGGLGLLLFDEERDGVRVGPVMLDYSGPLTDTLRATVTAFANGDNDKNPIDLTEAVLEWRPVPASQWRWRAKLGAFYPPVSMENRGIGWQSIYSLSPSAINTWIGEEVRTIGGELSLTAAGAGVGRPFDISAIVGVYGWNDPMGVVIQQRGWAIHDRQTALFGRLPDINGLPAGDGSFELFREIDNRVGYYAGLEFSWQDRVVARALHYDNRGDPAQFDKEEYAWLSRFDSFGVRIELPRDWTVIAQRLEGDTGIGASNDGKGYHILDFSSEFVLVSKAYGRHRGSARYERFQTRTVRASAFFNSNQDGDAWTLAYRYDVSDRWQLQAEALQIDSTLSHRRLQGTSPGAVERSLQLVARYSLTL